MPLLHKILIVAIILLFSITGFAQSERKIDSLKKELANATDIHKKVKLLDILSRSLMTLNMEESERYGQELIKVAEKSRDREAMTKAYISNGTRCTYMAGLGDYSTRAMEYFEKAKKIAAENKLYDLQVGVLLKQSALQLSIANKEKAAAFLDHALSVSSNIKDDSIHVLIKLAAGDVRMSKNEKIEALRSYLAGLRLAEKIKNHSLIRNSYQSLSKFYSNIEDYDKAIDYYVLSIDELKYLSTGNEAYQRVMDINSVGDLYSQKQNYVLAIEHYEDALAMADSLDFDNLKMPVYISLLNVYIFMKEPAKSLAFMNSESGQGLKQYFHKAGVDQMTDHAFAIIYSEMGKLDSAEKYFDRSAPLFLNSENPVLRMNRQFVESAFYKKKKEYNKAIGLLLMVNEMAKQNGELEVIMETSKNLDTLYGLIGNFEQSRLYAASYFQMKDSLQKINKEKELTQVEAQDEQERQQKIEEEQAEKKRQRNNIQYLAITIGIVTLFLMMVLFGMFRVSAGTIRMVGFFAFLMFFEFIFLIFKKNIYSITHGEPWMDLAFMIGLAALLLPFHHWLEHKVLHYLTSTNQLTSAGTVLKSRIFRKNRV